MYYKKEVKIDGEIMGKSYPIDLSVCLKGFDLKPDCQIGHFGYNFYIRTPYGMKRKSYKSNKSMEKAIEKCLKNRGFKVLGWVKK